eukprot:1979667-Prorocentrum_lima.AAC.1
MGWMQDPRAYAPPPLLHLSMRWVDGLVDPDAVVLWCTDGSGLNSVDPVLRRAGWAAVGFNPQ